MFGREVIKKTATIAGLTLWSATAFAQTPAPSPRRPSPPVRVGPRVTGESRRPAPQVVTIVHRLNGLKMFRLLLRSQQQVQAIAGLESPFNLMDDVYTNVIAGVAMDDGETIAAWLPEADVEFGPPAFSAADWAPLAPAAPPKAIEAPAPNIKESYFYTPDVTVIGPDGKQLPAKYLGFDATTGLCILQLTGKNLSPPAAMKDQSVDVGENVLLFGPEPAMRAQAMLGKSVYVRMGAIEGRVQKVLPAPSGEIARFKVIAARLSQANIGGVAVNEAGETLGIVDGLQGNEASILPAAAIRRAARRVLEQQASVPRPWLGVKGEAVAAMKLDQIQSHGWPYERAFDLADKHRGILLTSIAPDSPAARAALRAGDVILKVNDKEILSENDFTWWLEQAGPSRSVRFTVARPDRLSEEALSVKLSGRLDPAFTFSFGNRFPTTPGFSLIEQGIEAIALRPPVASQLGTTAGLLIVYVEPSTPASEAGLLPGDVIQSIDGKPALPFDRTRLPPGQELKLEVIRNKQKLTVTIGKRQ